MQIESYEAYHMGAKLSLNVSYEPLRKKLIPKLKEAGYKIEDREEKGIITRHILGSKNDVIAEINKTGGAINAIGTDPEAVMKVLKDLLGFMEKTGHELANTIIFYELVANINVKSSSSPTGILKKAVTVDPSPVKEYCECEVSGFRISTVKQNKTHDAINVFIDTSPLSPSSAFVLRVEYRAAERSRFDSFHKKREDILHKLLKSVKD